MAIVEAVRDEEGSFALVAEEDGELVGHIQLSRAWVGENPLLALGPIGVVPAGSVTESGRRSSKPR